MVRTIKKKDRPKQIECGDRTWEQRGIGDNKFTYISIDREDGDKYDNEQVFYDGRVLTISLTCSCREDIEIPRQMLEELLAMQGFKVVPITQEAEAVPDASGGG